MQIAEASKVDKTLIDKIMKFAQKSHRIDVLLLLHEQGMVQWRDVKKRKICCDEVFRRACIELTYMGLADMYSLRHQKGGQDSTKHRWRLNDLGVVVADIFKRAKRDINILVESHPSSLFVRGCEQP